ncbi:NAD(P)-binding protein [Neosynechococcus sphagnicola]|uniref:NAD(P)-binding protein n=1 Tax=Neosynechococcus sphagnicola TaxID=1501145 RepID=UPI000A746038
MTSNAYDIIIIGTGAGGSTLAHRLAPTGKKILVLERGSFLPREKANWDTVAVVQQDRYHTKEVWHDQNGHEIHPGVGYFVGGNTKRVLAVPCFVGANEILRRWFIRGGFPQSGP